MSTLASSPHDTSSAGSWISSPASSVPADDAGNALQAETHHTSSVSLTLSGEPPPDGADSSGACAPADAREALANEASVDSEGAEFSVSSRPSEIKPLGDPEGTPAQTEGEEDEEAFEENEEEAEVSLPSSAFHSMATAQTGAVTSVTGTDASPMQGRRHSGQGHVASPEPLLPFGVVSGATMVGRGGDSEEEKEESGSSADFTPLRARGESASLASSEAAATAAAAEGGGTSEVHETSTPLVGLEWDAQTFTVLHREEEGRAGLELVEAEERRCVFRAFRAIIPLLLIYRADWEGIPYCTPFMVAGGTEEEEPAGTGAQTPARPMLPPYREQQQSARTPLASAEKTDHYLPSFVDRARERRGESPSERASEYSRSHTSLLIPSIVTAQDQRERSAQLSQRPAGELGGASSSTLLSRPSTAHAWASRFEDSVGALPTRRRHAVSAAAWAADTDGTRPAAVGEEPFPRPVRRGGSSSDRWREAEDNTPSHGEDTTTSALGVESDRGKRRTQRWNSSTNIHSLSAPSRFVEPLLPGTEPRHESLHCAGGDQFLSTSQYGRFYQMVYGDDGDGPPHEQARWRGMKPRSPDSSSALRHAGNDGDAVDVSAIRASISPDVESIAPLPPPRAYPPVTEAVGNSRHSRRRRSGGARKGRHYGLLARLPRPLSLVKRRLQRLDALQLLLRGEVEQEWAEDLGAIADLFATQTTALLNNREPSDPQPDGTPKGPTRWQELPPSCVPSPVTPPADVDREGQEPAPPRPRSPSPCYYSRLLHAEVNVNLRLTPQGGGECPYPIRDGDRLRAINDAPVNSLEQLQRWESATADGGRGSDQFVTLVRPDGMLVLRVTSASTKAAMKTPAPATRKRKGSRQVTAQGQ